MLSKNRNYGLDLLRMLSMFLIVNLHVLGQGGAMVRVTGREAVYYSCWFVETCAYCAVDCYGLISGYVGVDSKHRPARILELWLQVFFYSAGITLLFRIFSPELLTEGSLWNAIFPVGWKTYWYFSAYVGLFFVMPYLNRLVNALEERELKKLALMLFLLFSVATALPKVNGSDFLQMVGGYSFVWLAVLYLLGACIKKCHFQRREKWKYLLAYFAMAAFSWIFKIGMENYTRKVYGEAKFGRLFTSYTAPTILLCAVCLLLIFETLEIKSEKGKKWITYLSPLAFSVYLIHTHPLVFGTILKGAFSGYRSLPAPLAVLAVLASAVLIYIACTLVDIVRRKLFKLGKVRSKCEKAVDVVAKRISSIE